MRVHSEVSHELRMGKSKLGLSAECSKTEETACVKKKEGACVNMFQK